MPTTPGCTSTADWVPYAALPESGYRDLVLQGLERLADRLRAMAGSG